LMSSMVSKLTRLLLLILAVGLIPIMSTWPKSWFTTEVASIAEPAIDNLSSLPFAYVIALVSIPTDIILIVSLWVRWLGGDALLRRRIRPEKGLTGDESGVWTVFCRSCGRKLKWNKDKYCDRCRLPVTYQNMGIRVVKAHYFLSNHAFKRVRQRVGTIGRLRETLRAGVRIEPDPVEPNDKLIVTQTGVTCIVGAENVIVTVRPTNYNHLKAVAEGPGHIVSIEAEVGYAPQQTRWWGFMTWGTPEVPLIIFTMWLSTPALLFFFPTSIPLVISPLVGLPFLLLIFAFFSIFVSGIRNWMIWRRAKRDYDSQ